MRTAFRLCSFLLASGCALATAPGVAHAQFAPPGVYLPPPPHVFFHPRVRWHHPVVVVNAPPPVWVAPAAPSPPPPPVYITAPPPVYIQPQAPIYVQPQPYYAQPPVYYTTPAPVVPPPPVVVRPVQPQWAAPLGFGATVEGVFDLAHRDYKGWGVMGQLRYRAARHFGLELMGGYERSTNPQSQTRSDVPITLGMMIPFLGPERALSPYLVGGFGVNFADLRILDAPTLQIDDKRTQAIAQLGFGLDLRLGKHFAINADARVEGRWSIDGPSDAVANTTSVDGKPVSPIQNTVGLRLGAGASVYF